jgi:hypothetical protein
MKSACNSGVRYATIDHDRLFFLTAKIPQMARYVYIQPCPMRYEPEQGVYFQPEMSLKRENQA